MAGNVLIVVAMLLAAILVDGLIRPRPLKGPFGSARRSVAGIWLLGTVMTALFGFFLALCGSVPVAACLALALLMLFAMVSNAKHAVLGEPLLFSDLALIGAVFRHPQFYLSAVSFRQRGAILLAVVALIAFLVWLSVPTIVPHLAGVAFTLGSAAILAWSVGRGTINRLAQVPDSAADVQRHGLAATLLLYWLRWRTSRDPPACSSLVEYSGRDPAGRLLIVVQCESFSDPIDLLGDPTLSLPALSRARADAWQHGRLQVSGFGAYTMRTEYGVLFGRSEDELGFRRYDPFLTALGEASYALPARLGAAEWRSLFVHPHDLRFYGRNRIMPAVGFARLYGQEAFGPVTPGEGRYVTDAAVADRIIELAGAQSNARHCLIYAVTIENHGPWAAKDATPNECESPASGYLQLVRRSDDMLASLMERIANMRRPAILVFFGDHRPSIPDVTNPVGDRDTPYVILRYDAEGRVQRDGKGSVDLTPAGLHHAILDSVTEPAFTIG